jgi:hypothetical protein
MKTPDLKRGLKRDPSITTTRDLLPYLTLRESLVTSARTELRRQNLSAKRRQVTLVTLTGIAPAPVIAFEWTTEN